MFRIDRPIARISLFLVLYRVPAVALSLCGRVRNRMDSYRVSIVDVPESPISSGARGPWQLQMCDSLHCHEEWWCSIPPSVFVFSLALDEGDAPGMCSSRQRLPSTLEVQHGAVLPHQCLTPQWTSPAQHILSGPFSLDEDNRDAFIHFIGVSSFVRMRERGSRHLPFITVPTRPVRLHGGAIALPRKFHGYPTRCKFAVTQNVVQNVEHIFVPYWDFRSYSRAVHRRSAYYWNLFSEFSAWGRPIQRLSWTTFLHSRNST